jgi:predicted phosphodiesterase
MQLLVLSDIHANLSALEAVLQKARSYKIDAVVLLGDHIDYGMRPNEVIEVLQTLPYPVDVNIWGNHEKAIIDGDLSRFSTDRGREFSKYSGNLLSENSKKYLNAMTQEGFTNKSYNGKSFLFIHGSLEDVYWKSIQFDTAGTEYQEYDYVLSGHSHKPLYFEKF